MSVPGGVDPAFEGDGGDSDCQEVPENLDVAACWRVIAEQSTMLQSQQALLRDMAEEIKSLRVEMGNREPRSPKDDSKLSVDEIVKMMDRRGSPPPEPFDLSVGGSFDDFMDQFEAYCRGKYSPTTYDRWSGELGSFLKGEILQIYKIWGGGIITLTEMKLKLKNFCATEADKDMSLKITKLTSATPEVGELPHIYVFRLERLYMTAHPGTNPEYCVELHTRLLNTLPNKCREEIQREIDQQKITLGINMVKWSSIVQMLKCYSERNSVAGTTPQTPVIKSDPIWFTSSNVYGPSQKLNQGSSERQSRSRQRNNNQRQYRSQSFSRVPQRQPVFSNNFNSHPNNYTYPINYNHPNNYNPPSHYNHPGNFNHPSSCSGRGGYHNRNGNFYNGAYKKFTKPNCDFCGLPGHEAKVCWRRLGCCVRCGSLEHYARECPKPRRQRQPPQQTNNQFQQYNQQVNYGNQGYHNNRTLSLDRQNYLQNTPLNPYSPPWVPQVDETNQGNGQQQSSLNQQASA